MRRITSNTFILLLMLFILVPMDRASADAWWGYGARRPEWVLSHGGSIIRYEINNISGESKEYKAVMFDAKGRYVEKEFGAKAMFDDAKDGTYTIKAYRGGTADKTTHKGGKSFSKITVTAHPGETIKLKFDYKKRKVKLATDYIEPAPKSVVVKPALTQSEEPAIIEEDRDLPIEPTEEIVHPDVMVSEENTIAKLEENQDNFKNFWEAIIKILKMI